MKIVVRGQLLESPANTIDAFRGFSFLNAVLLGSLMRNAVRLAGLLLVVLLSSAPISRAQENSDGNKDGNKKHYLTFQVGYRGTASKLVSGEFGRSETNIEVDNRFSGRVEVRPTEAYDLPTNLSAEAQMKRALAMQAAVLAGDRDKLKQATPGLLVTWFPRGDQVEITGRISEKMTVNAAGAEHGESRATSDLASEAYDGDKVFEGSFANAFVKIRPEEKLYDLQFTLMPDMASTWEAVRQTVVKEHKEEGHNTQSHTEAKVPLDMGPGQWNLGYSNYQIVAEVKGQPLAGEANELIGSTSIQVPKPAGWGGSWDIALEVSWQIDISLPPLELVITAPGYEEWRPEGNIKKPIEPGNKLLARATLKPKDGEQGKFVPRVKHIRFQLLDTSREPGICLNWPLEAKDTDYDLRLAVVAGGELSKSDQALAVTDPRKNDEGHYYAETQIDSYDFGGRASLRAVCLLNDGREIEGVMKDVGEMPRLPKMKNPGWIADSWRKARQAGQLADDDDSEKIKGQKDDGDGFTLYEEYRGWVEKGKRREGDPAGKDFFVLNLIGGDANGGIDLFEKLSELKVHAKLKRSEMSEKTRLMNDNRRDGPHNKDQHGVWLKTFGSKSALGDDGAMTVMNQKGVAGRPGLVDGIGILARDNTESTFNQPFNLPAQDAIFAYDRAIAHELLHSVGVEHHGNGDRKMTLNYNPPNSRNNRLGRPYYGFGMLGQDPVSLLSEGGDDIAVRDLGLYTQLIEFYRQVHGTRLLAEARRLVIAGRNNQAHIDTPEKKVEADLSDMAAAAMPMSGIVGVEQGEHSGAEDCLMRYYFAKFYESKKPAVMGSKVYHLIEPGTERIGMEICRHGKGTGVNAAGHKPQSRYGDAAAEEGNCFEQICPNDAIPPRKTK